MIASLFMSRGNRVFLVWKVIVYCCVGEIIIYSFLFIG